MKRKQFLALLEHRAENYKHFISEWPALWQDILREAAEVRRSLAVPEKGHDLRTPRPNIPTLPAPRNPRNAHANSRKAGLVPVEQIPDAGLPRTKTAAA